MPRMPLTFDHTAERLDPTLSTPKTELDGRVVIAWQSSYGAQGQVLAGERYPANDPRVMLNPANFVPDGTPRDAWPNPVDVALDRTKAQAEAVEAERQVHFEAAAKQNKVKLSVQLFRLQRDIFARVGGLPATVERGSVVLGNDPLITEFPDEFKPA